MGKADRIKVKRAAKSLASMKDEMARALDRSFLAAIEALKSVTAPPQPALVKKPEAEDLEEGTMVEERGNDKT